MNDNINLQQLFIKLCQLFSVCYIYLRISVLHEEGNFEILNSKLILTPFQIGTITFIQLFITDLIQIVKGQK